LALILQQSTAHKVAQAAPWCEPILLWSRAFASFSASGTNLRLLFKKWSAPDVGLEVAFEEDRS
jgi:hypothetical protein